MKVGKYDGLAQAALAVGLIAAVVWSCRPPDAATVSGHDPATCEVCRHRNSNVGVKYDAHDLYVGAERHLALCEACRAAGLTPERMVEMNTVTPCRAGFVGDQP